MLASDSIFRQRNFVLYVLGRLCSGFGAQMQTVAVGWQVYQQSGSPLALGLVGLSQFAPFLLLVLPAGYLADHVNRRYLLVVCYLLQIISALSMAWYSASGITVLWPVFVIMTLLGVQRALAMPTAQALLSQLVPETHLARAIPINSTANQSTTVLGPVLGGLLLIHGVQAVYLVVLGCALISLMLAMNIRGVSPQVAESNESESRLAALFGGIHFVWRQPLLLGAISLDLVAVLFGGATALLPIYAADILHVGPAGLGWLRSATGIGAVLAALWLSVKPLQRHAGLWMFGSVFTFGMATLTFGASTNIVLSVLALTLAGASDMVSVYVRSYLLQMLTPDALRGRVGSVSAVFVGASNELGEFESGTTASWWGASRAVMVGGTLTIGFTLWWLRLFPALRTMDRFPGRTDAVPPPPL